MFLNTLLVAILTVEWIVNAGRAIDAMAWKLYKRTSNSDHICSIRVKNDTHVPRLVAINASRPFSLNPKPTSLAVGPL